MASSLTPLLAPLWKRNQPLIRERLELLERAAHAPDDAGLRLEAMATAHKLAGSLGMFGFPRGTALARELEVRLEAGPVSSGDQLALVQALRQELFPAPGAEEPEAKG